MNELDSRAKELIGWALEGEGPTPAERSRMRGAVFARVGVGVAVVSALPGTAAATTATAGGAAAGAIAGGGSMAVGLVAKVVAAIALATAVGAGGYVAVSGHASAARASDPVTPIFAQGVTVASPAVDRHSSPPAPATPATPPALAPPPTPTLLAPAPPPATLEPAATGNASSSPNRSLAEETRALKDAIADFRDGHVDRALAEIDEQDARFLGGALAEERAETRIAALCALGRNDEARADASRFLRAHPRSLLAGRVRASCGGNGSEVGR